MSRPILSLLLAAAAGLGVTAGHAATLGFRAEAPLLSGTGDVVHVPGSDLSFVGEGADGAGISLAVALSPLGGLDPDVAPGALLAGVALSGTVADIGFEIDGGTDGGDRIELLLDVAGGDFAQAFSGGAFAVLTGEFGTDEQFAATGFFSAATLEISPIAGEATPVPLPAGALLLASGLGVLGLRRRRLLEAVPGGRRGQRSRAV